MAAHSYSQFHFAIIDRPMLKSLLRAKNVVSKTLDDNKNPAGTIDAGGVFI